MCKYCEELAFNTIIESNYIQYGYNVFGRVGIYATPQEEDNSVVFEMRCGVGYIRLGDRSDMNCIDSDNKIKIKFCPMCGRKLTDEG